MVAMAIGHMKRAFQMEAGQAALSGNRSLGGRAIEWIKERPEAIRGALAGIRGALAGTRAALAGTRAVQSITKHYENLDLISKIAIFAGGLIGAITLITTFPLSITIGLVGAGVAVVGVIALLALNLLRLTSTIDESAKMMLAERTDTATATQIELENDQAFGVTGELKELDDTQAQGPIDDTSVGQSQLDAENDF